MYILSCDTLENKGGIYKYNDNFELLKYYPCDRPMYAAKNKSGLYVLLRQPFSDSNESGYFYIDDDLEKPTKIESSKGVVACHLAVDNSDLYIVNYLSGNIVKNGKYVGKRVGKSIHITRQTEPHTHFVAKTDDDFLAVCDLGTDTLCFYDENLKLISEAKVPSGYGIRHLVFSKDHRCIYAINELVPSISVFSYNNGQAKLINTVEIECDSENASGAAIRLSKDGKVLYVSIRNENAILSYLVKKEKLTLIQKVDSNGDSPRDFDIINNKLVVCNENSNNIVVYDMVDNTIDKKMKDISLSRPLCVI